MGFSDIYKNNCLRKLSMRHDNNSPVSYTMHTVHWICAAKVWVCIECYKRASVCPLSKGAFQIYNVFHCSVNFKGQVVN